MASSTTQDTKISIDTGDLGTKIDSLKSAITQAINGINTSVSGKQSNFENALTRAVEHSIQVSSTKLNQFFEASVSKVNKVYGQESVSVPIFGSGITRIKEHKNIEDEDLLKIMLWTFRISEMRFKYPAKLTIVIHKDKIKKINLFDIMSIKN
ncbi:macro domain-containing protein [Commensalibacter nepenthis]|uniref:DUF6430 domain-containing protein n=1 Tax=Commensalibacter nepenthis TaxID=3043872 RepID=A0ABT6QAE6_9PROT|nr:macro domain-containing protein [Commensalibacter sp. TBRC 10068]MDI2113867.1 DUF6430 domain-containing protein [Commensalibacter sp. TBRC 10068]